MIDSHCHLTHPRFSSDLEPVLARAGASGVVRSVTIGTGPADARRARELARAYPEEVSCTAGLDPFSAFREGERFDDALAELEALLREGGYVAVGEVGLDYHYDLDPRPVQRERFERQLGVAASLDLPVVIHVREAHEDLIPILAEHRRARGVIHSFTAGPKEAARYLELGWYLAFNGVITFSNAGDVREAVRAVPADRLLVETDSPFLAPVPHRGRRCEPAYVALTVAAVAEVRGASPAEVARLTSDNASRLFGLRRRPETRSNDRSSDQAG